MNREFEAVLHEYTLHQKISRALALEAQVNHLRKLMPQETADAILSDLEEISEAVERLSLTGWFAMMRLCTYLQNERESLFFEGLDVTTISLLSTEKQLILSFQEPATDEHITFWWNNEVWTIYDLHISSAHAVAFIDRFIESLAKGGKFGVDETTQVKLL